MREKDTCICYYHPGLESKEILYLIIIKTGSLNKIPKEFCHPNPIPDRNGSKIIEPDTEGLKVD